jgi:hypothetical protein
MTEDEWKELILTISLARQKNALTTEEFDVLINLLTKVRKAGY